MLAPANTGFLSSFRNVSLQFLDSWVCVYWLIDLGIHFAFVLFCFETEQLSSISKGPAEEQKTSALLLCNKVQYNNFRSVDLACQFLN